MEGWFEALKVSIAHNRDSSRLKRCQAGGTAMVATNKMSYCVKSCGGDGRNLGRWTWMVLRGNNGVKTRVVTVYGLNRPTNDPTDHTCYHTQRRCLDAQNINTDPRTLFWDDLRKCIEQWRTDGEQLIIGGDWNLPIHQVTEKLKGLGLIDSVTHKHGLTNAPATYNRGSKPIDGILVSASLQGVRCGYLPFNKGPSVDHRIIWVDFMMDHLLGFTLDDLPQPKARRLQLRDPRIIQRYQDILDQFCAKHDLYNRSEKVVEQLVYPLPRRLQQEANKIDKLRTEGMILAERKCRKLRTGRYAWSPTFQEAIDSIRFWTMAKQRAAGTKIDTKRLLRMIRQGFQNPENLTDDEILQKVDEAWDHYRHVKKNSIQYRMDFLEDLAKALAEANNISKASALRSLRHREEIRRISVAIKFTMKKLFSDGTFRVLVPSGNKQYKEVTDRTKLEDILIRENIKKYHRTEAYCPLLIGQLFKDIGILCDGPEVQAILDGTYQPPPGTSRGTKAYLAKMKSVELSPEAEERATRSNVDEFCFEWSKVKEHTSSFGQLHYGHFKAGCRHDKLKHLHFNLAEVGMVAGYYTLRHAQGLDVMLPKDKDDHRAHRFRTICLFEADLNMNQRRTGKAGLASEILNNSFSDEQYSRPGRSAMDHVINKRLSFDYFNFIRRPYGLTSCDLAGNYDRIVHNAAMLALMRAGVPYARLRGMFETLQHMVKRVKTAYGTSAKTYGGKKPDWPYFLQQQGVFQGNAAGPAIWSIISSTVFAILREEGYGVDFEQVYRLGGFAFVDDSDLLQSGDTALNVSIKMQEALVWWEDIMHTTGQAMEPSKSWWYLVDYVWKHGKWAIVEGDVHNDLIAHDSDGVAVSLTCLLVSQARKMLGVYLSPDGDESAELRYLTEKVTKWAECIRTGHLRSIETWIATSTCIWKTILYPMPVTSFTDQELRSLVAPIVAEAFSKMGVNPTFPIALRYGPSSLGGLGLVDPYFHQGAAKIQYLVEHPWKTTPTGQLLRTNLEALTIESGIFHSPLSHDFARIKDYISFPSWISTLWGFISEKKIVIHDLPFPTLSPKRRHDVSIMEYLMYTRNLRGPILRKLNSCRIFLNVVSVSDITDITGKYILTECYNLPRKPPPSHPRVCNRFHWPQQPCPPRDYWSLWREELIYSLADSRGFLTCPLGDWSADELANHSYVTNWDYFQCADSSTGALLLLENTGHGWSTFPPIISRTRRNMKYAARGHTLHAVAAKEYLLTAERVSTNADRGARSIMAHHRRPRNTSTDHTHHRTASLTDRLFHILSEQKEGSWMLTNFETSPDIADLIDDFVQGNTPTVSDGSYKQVAQLGTAAWSIESSSGHQYIKGNCVVPGDPEEQSAYRSELAGLLGITLYCWGLCQMCTPTQSCEVVVRCDGYSALRRSLASDHTSMSSRYKSFDLVAAIKGYWNKLPCQAFPVYVKGHADDEVPQERLTRLELMNVEMDRRAKDTLTAAILHSVDPPDPLYTFGMPMVYINGRPVVSELSKSIIHTLSRDRAVAYWFGKLQLSSQAFHSIHWVAFERAMTYIKRHKRFVISQWLCRQLLFLYRAFKKKHKRPALACPFSSNCSEETMEHFLRCRKVRSANVLHINSLHQWLLDNDTEPLLAESIHNLLLDWIRYGYVRTSTCRDFPPCLRLQEDIGWFNFFQGLQHESIASHQESHFFSSHSRRTGLVWHRKFIHELWLCLFTIYQDRKELIAKARPDIEDDDDAVPFLRDAACRELRRGQRSLPDFFRSYFSHSESALRNMSLRDLYGWMRTIRSGRERHEPHADDPMDSFSPTGHYREWLNL